MASRPRTPAVASGLLARPGGAPARTTPVEDLPRTGATSVRQRERPPIPGPPAGRPTAGGIKQTTVGTTLYLLPAEHKRVKQLALDLDVPSVHELILMGLDRLLAERTQKPLTRYSPPRPRKG